MRSQVKQKTIENMNLLASERIRQYSICLSGVRGSQQKSNMNEALLILSQLLQKDQTDGSRLVLIKEIISFIRKYVDFIQTLPLHPKISQEITAPPALRSLSPLPSHNFVPLLGGSTPGPLFIPIQETKQDSLVLGKVDVGVDTLFINDNAEDEFSSSHLFMNKNFENYNKAVNHVHANQFINELANQMFQLNRSHIQFLKKFFKPESQPKNQIDSIIILHQKEIQAVRLKILDRFNLFRNDFEQKLTHIQSSLEEQRKKIKETVPTKKGCHQKKESADQGLQEFKFKQQNLNYTIKKLSDQALTMKASHSEQVKRLKNEVTQLMLNRLNQDKQITLLKEEVQRLSSLYETVHRYQQYYISKLNQAVVNLIRTTIRNKELQHKMTKLQRERQWLSKDNITELIENQINKNNILTQIVKISLNNSVASVMQRVLIEQKLPEQPLQQIKLTYNDRPTHFTQPLQKIIQAEEFEQYINQKIKLIEAQFFTANDIRFQESSKASHPSPAQSMIFKSSLKLANERNQQREKKSEKKESTKFIKDSKKKIKKSSKVVNYIQSYQTDNHLDKAFKHQNSDKSIEKKSYLHVYKAAAIQLLNKKKSKIVEKSDSQCPSQFNFTYFEDQPKLNKEILREMQCGERMDRKSISLQSLYEQSKVKITEQGPLQINCTSTKTVQQQQRLKEQEKVTKQRRVSDVKSPVQKAVVKNTQQSVNTKFIYHHTLKNKHQVQSQQPLSKSIHFSKSKHFSQFSNTFHKTQPSSLKSQQTQTDSIDPQPPSFQVKHTQQQWQQQQQQEIITSKDKETELLSVKCQTQDSLIASLLQVFMDQIIVVDKWHQLSKKERQQTIKKILAQKRFSRSGSLQLHNIHNHRHLDQSYLHTLPVSHPTKPPDLQSLFKADLISDKQKQLAITLASFKDAGLSLDRRLANMTPQAITRLITKHRECTKPEKGICKHLLKLYKRVLDTRARRASLKMGVHRIQKI